MPGEFSDNYVFIPDPQDSQPLRGWDIGTTEEEVEEFRKEPHLLKDPAEFTDANYTKEGPIGEALTAIRITKRGREDIPGKIYKLT